MTQKRKHFLKRTLLPTVVLAALLLLGAGCGIAVAVSAAEGDNITVTYDRNGARGYPNPMRHTGVSPLTVTTPEVTTSNSIAKDGYTFMGWNTESDGSGETYAEATEYTFYDSVTLYAKWVKNAVLRFDRNFSGSGSPPSARYGAPDLSTELPDINIRRDHYTFIGWNTDPNGGREGNFYKVGDTFTVKGDTEVTLYAQWVKNAVLRFDKNGSPHGSPPSAIYGNPNLSTTLPDIIIVRDYYTFIGWNTDPNGGRTGDFYKVGDTFTAEENTEVTLYAQWVKNARLFFDRGNCPYGSPPSVRYGDPDLSTELPGLDISWSGWDFIGWNTEKYGGRTGDFYEVGATFTAEENTETTLYAQWEGWTKLFYARGDATHGSPPLYVTDYPKIEQTVADNETLYKTGYTFKCWNTQSDGSGDNYYAGDQITVTGHTTVTLYPMWIKNAILHFERNLSGAVGSPPGTITGTPEISTQLPRSRRRRKNRLGFCRLEHRSECV